MTSSPVRRADGRIEHPEDDPGPARRQAAVA